MREPVQPRACGELKDILGLKKLSAGSAPRVRGTLSSKPSKTAAFRFSPARAGNSYAPARGKHQRPVQPRACGELSLPKA